MGLEAGVKGGFASLKSHWLFYLILIVLVIGLVYKYDTNQKIRGWLVGLPVVGKFFA